MQFLSVDRSVFSIKFPLSLYKRYSIIDQQIVYFSLCLFLSLSDSLSLFPFFSPSIFVSLPLSFSQYFWYLFISLFLFLSLSLSLSLSVSLSLSLCLSLSHLSLLLFHCTSMLSLPRSFIYNFKNMLKLFICQISPFYLFNSYPSLVRCQNDFKKSNFSRKAFKKFSRI